MTRFATKTKIYNFALDFDTSGSIRNPAPVNGAFGNRPTHGLVTLDNMV